MTEIGSVLMIAGAGLFLVGLLIVVGGRFAWFGNLPGDIVIKRENLTVFAPIGSMILLSILLTIVLNVVGRLFR
jgi:hypothetical protein